MVFIILEEIFNHKDFFMDTNHECKNSQFSDTLAGFFGKNINLAHIKLLSLFISALCKARTVCFSKLATCFDSKAKSDSCLRRIQRFYAKHTLDSDLVARLIFRLLPVKGPLQLAIDRTNWQFGKTDINIFMLLNIHDAFTRFPDEGMVTQKFSRMRT